MEGKAILAQLGITGDYEGIGHCIIGYPEGDLPAKKPRKENYVYWVEYNRKRADGNVSPFLMCRFT